MASSITTLLASASIGVRSGIFIKSEEYFRPGFVEKKEFFDEGPGIPYKKQDGSMINTGSIDTSNIDGFRQGIEITHVKHWDKGIVKIHAGEPGHILQDRRFGIDKGFRSDINEFGDIDLFDPVKFIQAQANLDQWFDINITFPIITRDYDASQNYSFNGIIEPLTIKEIASFSSINVPYDPHETRGALMAGNVDDTFASSLVLGIDEYSPSIQIPPYVDTIDMMGNMSLDGYYDTTKRPLLPYDDSLVVFRDFSISPNVGEELRSVLIDIEFTTTASRSDTYVREDQFASSTGYTYFTTTNARVDSIAFGERLQ